MVYVNARVDAESIIDGMNESAEFMHDVLEGIAQGTEKGLFRDNASDLMAQMPAEKVKFLVEQFRSLSDAMESGYNMAHTQDLEM